MFGCNEFRMWRRFWCLLTSRFWICRFIYMPSLFFYKMSTLKIASNSSASYLYINGWLVSNNVLSWKLPVLLFPMPNLSWICVLGDERICVWEVCGHTKLLGFKMGKLTVWKCNLSYEGRVEDNLNSSEIHEILDSLFLRCAALMFTVIQDHYIWKHPSHNSTMTGKIQACLSNLSITVSKYLKNLREGRKLSHAVWR